MVSRAPIGFTPFFKVYIRGLIVKPCTIIVYLLLTTLVCCDMADNNKTIQKVKRSHEHELLALPDVVSVCIRKRKDGNAAIIVGVARLNAETEKRIPENIEGYSVIVRLAGSIKAH